MKNYYVKSNDCSTIKENIMKHIKLPTLSEGLTAKRIDVAKQIFVDELEKGMPSPHKCRVRMSCGESPDGDKAYISMKNGDAFNLFFIFMQQLNDQVAKALHEKDLDEQEIVRAKAYNLDSEYAEREYKIKREINDKYDYDSDNVSFEGTEGVDY